MRVKFGEISEELAITHGIPLEEVTRILQAYSAAVRRLIAEDFIVEIAEGVRLQKEAYLDPRHNREAERIVVNPDYYVKRSTPCAATEIEEENERTSKKLGAVSSTDSE